ncbi:Ras-related GTP-binding protein D [Trichinella patagoniensis]|uniref:Ras-related GTP-binding protein D n=3 Tax=Trichinella TaxID=6333 RepID=A0A0V0ZMT1_9BILA|nr:Ras-related GTP-binding protein D [Trichinella patagoniensis]
MATKMTSLPETSEYRNSNMQASHLERHYAGMSSSQRDVHENIESAAKHSAYHFKPRMILMGSKRSGKSSIQKVIFHKMSPNETLFLESTTRVTQEEMSRNSFIQFQIWEYPGQVDAFDPELDPHGMFSACGAIIFVIDAQDDYSRAIQNLVDTVIKASRINLNINFEVFVHKVDGLADDQKVEAQREIFQRVNDDLLDTQFSNIQLNFYLTSIYDHSIFESFSRVVQKLIPELVVLENLLNIFISNSAIEKAFLFDLSSKIYIATDSSPVDMQSYELCCDMIDMITDLTVIYGSNSEKFDTRKESNSSSVIQLSNHTVLYQRQVNSYLAVVCILRRESFTHRGVINFNFTCLKNAISQVFLHRQEASKSTLNKNSVNRQ